MLLQLDLDVAVQHAAATPGTSHDGLRRQLRRANGAAWVPTNDIKHLIKVAIKLRRLLQVGLGAVELMATREVGPPGGCASLRLHWAHGAAWSLTYEP